MPVPFYILLVSDTFNVYNRSESMKAPTPTGLVYTNDAKDSIDAVKSKKNQFCRDSFYNEEDPKDC